MKYKFSFTYRQGVLEFFDLVNEDSEEDIELLNKLE